MSMKRMTTVFLLIIAMGTWSCAGEGKKSESENPGENRPAAGEVNVYSHRFYDADKELFKRFEEKTGIVVNVKMDDADRLIQLLQTEGENTPADLLIATDIGRIYYAKELGLLQAVSSPVLSERIPPHLRDKEGQWFGLTKRARVIMYNTDLVKPSELSTYEDLADPKWARSISVRSSTSVYNKSLMASIIAHDGEEKALAWAKGIVGNLATEPNGNDRDQLKNIVSGTGKIALVNTYYLGLMANSVNEAERAAAQKIKPFFPNQSGRGTHINISGAGLVKGAKNKENAMRLLEFLVSDEAQRLYAEANFEYPVNPAVQPPPLLQSWGDFREDTINLEELGKLQNKAIKIFEAAGWN